MGCSVSTHRVLYEHPRCCGNTLVLLWHPIALHLWVSHYLQCEKHNYFAKMKTKATEFRATENIKNVFMKVTRITSWWEAQERYPRHTLMEEKLGQFLSLNFVNNIPESFKAFVNLALQLEKTPLLTVPFRCIRVQRLQ